MRETLIAAPEEIVEIGDIELRQMFGVEIPEFLQNGDPLVFIKVLDKRNHKKVTTTHVIYEPGQRTNPPGLGHWNSPHLTETIFPQDPETWLELPRPGQHLGLKLASTKTGEREILLRTNQLFSPDDAVRPVRLIGYGTYGINENEFDKTYLLMEYLGKEFQPYISYLENTSIQEALSFAKAIAGLLVKLHFAGLVHGDLAGGGGKEHCLWYKKDNIIRLIDFDCSLNMNYPASGERFRPTMRGYFNDDQSGLADIIEDLVMGRREVVLQSIHPLLRKYPEKMARALYRIIQMGHGSNRVCYSSSPQGTRDMYEDIAGLVDNVDNIDSFPGL